MGMIKLVSTPRSNFLGGTSSLPQDRQQAARQASAALAQFMRTTGKQTVNMNDLLSIARNSSGSTPADVSDAASFMLSTPQLFSKLESRDDTAGTRDGIASVESFDLAASGAFDDTVKPTLLVGRAIREAAQEMPDHEALDFLNTYRAGNSSKRLDAQTLYQLAQNPASSDPPALAQAAKRALKSVDLMKQLQLNDGPGAPQKSVVLLMSDSLRNSAPDALGAQMR
ncbi:hypothetical protein [Paracidovorax anthurii]|uniref:Uncharacterized protein n=1 Tax=Paracidovorax anthurii TaxID=78229 RepID=A0A328ZGY0_9BURK|nr:hypothetical protein [Paracidovorax anthurii]RAR85488.1 hypothetical protein AX018_1005119 [Paracidovorax anthurii]